MIEYSRISKCLFFISLSDRFVLSKDVVLYHFNLSGLIDQDKILHVVSFTKCHAKLKLSILLHVSMLETLI